MECCPGRLPLFTAEPGSSAARFVSDESDTAYPVALEIPAVGPPEVVPGHDMDSLRQVRPNDDRLACFADGGLIPLTAVTAVHFRSQTADENLARRDEFANVVLDELPLTASQGVLDGEGPDAGAVTEWLGSLEPLQDPDEDALRSADGLAGARFMLASAAPPERQAFDALAACLQTSQIACGVDSAGPFDSLLPLQAQAGKEAQADGAEVRLFRCCAAVFAADNRRENSSSRLLLDEVRKALDSVGLASTDLEETQTTLDHIERLLMGERQFKPFTPAADSPRQRPASGSAAPGPPRATLLACGRDGRPRLRPHAGGGARGPEGGRERLPVALRPQPLRAFVVELQCSSSGRCCISLSPARGRISLLFSRPEAKKAMSVWTFSGMNLCSFPRHGLRPRYCRFSADADAASEPGCSAALVVSRAMKWSDCVATVILFSRDSFSITQGKGRLHELRTVGEVKVSESVMEDAFAARLQAEPAILGPSRRRCVASSSATAGPIWRRTPLGDDLGLELVEARDESVQ